MSSKFHTYFGYILAILLFIPGVYFYLDQKKTKEISYQFLPTTKLFDSKSTTNRIKVFILDSVPFDDDIFLINGYIWNSGDLAIQNQDIRENITISLDKKNTIVDYKINQQIDQEISKFRISQKNQYELMVSQQYFDPGNGLSFQIFYIGDSENDIKVSANIYGLNSINDNNQELYNPTTYLSILLFINVLIILVLIFSPRMNKRFKNGLMLFGMALVIFFVILGAFIDFANNNPNPFISN